MFFRVNEWTIEPVEKSLGPGLMFESLEAAKTQFRENLERKIEAAREMINKCENLIRENE